MAMTVAATITANMSVNVGGTIDGQTGSHKPSLSVSHSLTNGSGADNKANACIVKLSEAILAGATETVDLSGYTNGFFGETVTMVGLKYLMLKNTSTTSTTVLELGADAASVPIFNAVTNAIKVPAGGFVVWGVNTDDGKITVTAGTGDIISVKNLDGANAGAYELVLIGETA